MAEPSHMFCKIVQSGEVVEAYIYSNSIKVGHKREHEVVRRKKSDLDDEGLEKRSDNIYRSRKEVRRIIWANQGKYTKFITLTYKSIRKIHEGEQTYEFTYDGTYYKGLYRPCSSE